jgi:cytochrome b561
VALVALQYLFHDGVASAFESGLEEGTLTLSAPVIAHFVNGSLIFLLVAWRLMLRGERGVPEPPAEDRPWQRGLARGVHLAFYGVIALLVATGGAAWAMASQGASTAHEILRALLPGLIALHVAGAVHGQAVQKTGVLDRMRRPAD